MSNWESFLKEDTLRWLLEDSNPSVKYFTLTDLMNKRSNSSDVKTAKAGIMTEGPVPKILSKQNPGGYWEKSSSFYLPKYKGTVWSLSILAELGADGNDERIKQTCEYILENSQHRESGAFSHISYQRYKYQKNKNNLETPFLFKSDIKGGSPQVIPCLTGNMLQSLIRCGYLEDHRVQKGIEWIIEYQRFDDAIEKAPTGWPYNAGPRKGTSCWGKHTCHNGVIMNLRALSEIPEKKRSQEVKDTIKKASEYFLKHRIYKRSHNLNRIAIPGWMNIGFPLSGLLAVLFTLSKLGYKDERMQNSADLLLKKQNKNGRWVMEASLNGRMHANIEKKGEESKWVTLYALTSLKNFYG